MDKNFIGILVILSSVVNAAAQYRGKLLGDFVTMSHGVAGKIYAVDDKRLTIVDFVYDGLGPDAYFWYGDSGSKADSSGIIVPDETMSTAKLPKYEKKTITIMLPSSKTVSNMKWLSVWCKQHSVNFGQLVLTSAVVPPKDVVLGQISGSSHGVSSGDVVALNNRQLRISGFNYDGTGPEVHFWIGADANAINTGSAVGSALKSFTGATETITLPADNDLFKIKFLSIYSVTDKQSYGHVTITGVKDGDLLPHPYTTDLMPSMTPNSMKNCESLHERFNLNWEIDASKITIEMEATLEADEYVAFGVSGKPDSTSMDGADVIVGYLDSGMAKADDYYLGSRAQCSGGKGACRDKAAGGNSDVTVEQGSLHNGVTTIKASRQLNTGETKYDLVWDTSKEIFIVWAIGKVTADNEKTVTKHHTVVQPNTKLHLGRTPLRNCRALQARKKVEVKPWETQTIRGDMAKNFTISLGPSGGAQGVEAITKQSSWGVALYVNGKLIPEITVRRGDTYKFVIESGDDESNDSQYHPVYITDDNTGGYGKEPEKKKNKRNFAGITADGKVAKGAAGRFCEYKENGKSADQFKDFPSYAKSLTRNCASGKAGQFEWTPDEDTPDLVYYQCYQHKYLGWKIHVTDEFTSAASEARVTLAFATLNIIISLSLMLK